MFLSRFPVALPAAILALGLALAPRPSPAIFYAASRAIRAADKLMEQGIKAEAEENVEEAKKSYEAAISAYAEIRQKHPTASPELVIEHQEECHRRLHALWADDPLSDDNAEQKRREFLAALPPEISEGELPRNQVSLPRAASPESPGENLVEHTDAPAPTSSEAPPASASLSDRVEFFLRENRAAEAVVELDGIVGAAGDQAPLLHRLLLAKALIASGNNARAIAILEPLAEENPNDPAVLTLAAGANLAHGNPHAAVRHLETLLRNHNSYADVYVNLAYARFAIDPDENRQEAILYYQHALNLGAERDLNLERELRVRVAP